MPTSIWLILGLFALCAVLLSRRVPMPVDDNEPTEFGATFDALQAEADEAAKIKARALAHERAQKAADDAVIAKFGPKRDATEL